MLLDTTDRAEKGWGGRGGANGRGSDTQMLSKYL